MKTKKIIKSCGYIIVSDDNKFKCVEGYLIPERYTEKDQYIKRCPNCNLKGEQ